MKGNFQVSITLLLLAILYSVPSSAQVELTTSNLPILIVDTGGETIVDEPKIPATLGIIDNGPGVLNNITDPFNDYDGNIGIELRGSTSQFLFDKKSYGVETWTPALEDTSVSLLGLPTEEDWVLHGPYSDKTLMRNLLSFHLWSFTGWYGSRSRLCELVINGDYKGVYVLLEKVKRDKDRVAISRLNPDENSGDDLTGGYIVKLDKFDGSNSGEGFVSPYAPPRRTSGEQIIFFQFDYPKGRDITGAQRQYIEDYVTAFEDALASPDFRNPVTGYRAYADANSFVDMALLNELTRNVDAYRLSTFLYKNKESVGGKLVMGPPWDFNLAFGNANYCSGSDTEGWGWDFNNVCYFDFWLNPFWWDRFRLDGDFILRMQQRWQELRQGPWSNNSIMNFIDSVATVLNVPQQRNFQRWDVQGSYVWPNNFVGSTYQEDVDYLKSWITDRLDWLDTNINTLEVITALEDDPDFSINIYPNPMKDRVQIESSIPVDNVRIIDMMGREKMSFRSRYKSKRQEILLYDIAPGVYMLNIQLNNGSVINRRLAINP